MSQINIYKIDPTLKQAFFEQLQRASFVQVGQAMNETSKIKKQVEVCYNLEFYLCTKCENATPNWQWVLECFKSQNINRLQPPKAVLVLTTESTTYACTFGTAHFNVDKFADVSFPFALGRKLRFEEIRTTALTSPSSKRNKSINTYIDYLDLEFDSGEAFTKIKAKLNPCSKSKIIGSMIELGHSVKINLRENKLEHICYLITLAERFTSRWPDINKIPVFEVIKDKDQCNELFNSFKETFKGDYRIHLSELDIIGVTEFFNSRSKEFVILCDGERIEVDYIDYEVINDFVVDKFKSTLEEKISQIKIITKNDGKSVRTDSLLSLLDYTDDAKKCILIKGKWYKYNDDYVNYLNDSISEIRTVYEARYDFSHVMHSEYIDEKYKTCKDEEPYNIMTEEEGKKKLKFTWYKERVFNILRARDDGFTNHDRDGSRVGKHIVELMDLYKDEAMYAVKIGNASSTLCYAVDQSLTSLQAWRKKEITFEKDIKKVVLWLVLDRAMPLPMIDGQPDLRVLEMLSLKNKIDSWKKAVRQAGLEPIIAINYYQAPPKQKDTTA